MNNALFGSVFVDVQWSGRSVVEASGNREEKTAEGRGLLCFVLRGSSSSIVVLPGSFARGTISARDADGNSASGIYESTNDGNTGWWGYGPARISPTTGVIQRGNFVIAGSGIPLFASVVLVRHLWAGFAQINAVPSLGAPCTFSECPPEAGYCRAYQFSDTDAGGFARAQTTLFPAFPGGQTGEGSIDVTWTRDLSCRVGGGFAPRVPPGIDPATLRPYTPGCPGCGGL
jgi:hypothetical protein